MTSKASSPRKRRRLQADTRTVDHGSEIASLRSAVQHLQKTLGSEGMERQQRTALYPGLSTIIPANSPDLPQVLMLSTSVSPRAAAMGENSAILVDEVNRMRSQISNLSNQVESVRDAHRSLTKYHRHNDMGAAGQQIPLPGNSYASLSVPHHPEMLNASSSSSVSDMGVSGGAGGGGAQYPPRQLSPVALQNYLQDKDGPLPLPGGGDSRRASAGAARRGSGSPGKRQTVQMHGEGGGAAAGAGGEGDGKHYSSTPPYLPVNDPVTGILRSMSGGAADRRGSAGVGGSATGGADGGLGPGGFSALVPPIGFGQIQSMHHDLDSQQSALLQQQNRVMHDQEGELQLALLQGITLQQHNQRQHDLYEQQMALLKSQAEDEVARVKREEHERRKADREAIEREKAAMREEQKKNEKQVSRLQKSLDEVNAKHLDEIRRYDEALNEKDEGFHLEMKKMKESLRDEKRSAREKERERRRRERERKEDQQQQQQQQPQQQQQQDPYAAAYCPCAAMGGCPAHPSPFTGLEQPPPMLMPPQPSVLSGAPPPSFVGMPPPHYHSPPHSAPPQGLMMPGTSPRGFSAGPPMSAYGAMSSPYAQSVIGGGGASSAPPLSGRPQTPLKELYADTAFRVGLPPIRSAMEKLEGELSALMGRVRQFDDRCQDAANEGLKSEDEQALTEAVDRIVNVMKDVEEHQAELDACEADIVSLSQADNEARVTQSTQTLGDLFRELTSTKKKLETVVQQSRDQLVATRQSYQTLLEQALNKRRLLLRDVDDVIETRDRVAAKLGRLTDVLNEDRERLNNHSDGPIDQDLQSRFRRFQDEMYTEKGRLEEMDEQTRTMQRTLERTEEYIQQATSGVAADILRYEQRMKRAAEEVELPLRGLLTQSRKLTAAQLIAKRDVAENAKAAKSKEDRKKERERIRGQRRDQQHRLELAKLEAAQALRGNGAGYNVLGSGRPSRSGSALYPQTSGSVYGQSAAGPINQLPYIINDHARVGVMNTSVGLANNPDGSQMYPIPSYSSAAPNNNNNESLLPIRSLMFTNNDGSNPNNKVQQSPDVGAALPPPPPPPPLIPPLPIISVPSAASEQFSVGIPEGDVLLERQRYEDDIERLQVRLARERQEREAALADLREKEFKPAFKKLAEANTAEMTNMLNQLKGEREKHERELEALRKKTSDERRKDKELEAEIQNALAAKVREEKLYDAAKEEQAKQEREMQRQELETSKKETAQVEARCQDALEAKRREAEQKGVQESVVRELRAQLEEERRENRREIEKLRARQEQERREQAAATQQALAYQQQQQQQQQQQAAWAAMQRNYALQQQSSSCAPQQQPFAAQGRQQRTSSNNFRQVSGQNSGNSNHSTGSGGGQQRTSVTYYGGGTGGHRDSAEARRSSAGMRQSPGIGVRQQGSGGAGGIRQGSPGAGVRQMGSGGSNEGAPQQQMNTGRRTGPYIEPAPYPFELKRDVDARARAAEAAAAEAAKKMAAMEQRHLFEKEQQKREMEDLLARSRERFEKELEIEKKNAQDERSRREAERRTSQRLSQELEAIEEGERRRKAKAAADKQRISAARKRAAAGGRGSGSPTRPQPSQYSPVTRRHLPKSKRQNSASAKLGSSPYLDPVMPESLKKSSTQKMASPPDLSPLYIDQFNSFSPSQASSPPQRREGARIETMVEGGDWLREKYLEEPMYTRPVPDEGGAGGSGVLGGGGPDSGSSSPSRRRRSQASPRAANLFSHKEAGSPRSVGKGEE